MEVIRKVALAVFQDQKILMARYVDANVFYFVGGQVRENEDDKECLVRKVPNEIGAEVLPDSLVFLQEFEDKADGRENTMLSLTLYTGKLKGDVKPSHDVGEIRYIGSHDDATLVSVIAVNQVFPWLKQQELLQ